MLWGRRLTATLRAPGQEGLGIAAEHGYFFRAAGATGWESRHEADDGFVHAWREMVLPIFQVRHAASTWKELGYRL